MFCATNLNAQQEDKDEFKKDLEKFTNHSFSMVSFHQQMRKQYFQAFSYWMAAVVRYKLKKVYLLEGFYYSSIIQKNGGEGVICGMRSGLILSVVMIGNEKCFSKYFLGFSFWMVPVVCCKFKAVYFHR